MESVFCKESTPEHWDKKHGEKGYDYLDHDVFKMCFKRIAREIGDLSEKEGKSLSVVELGCHSANLLEYLDYQSPYLGFDVSQVAVDIAKKHWKTRPNCKLLQGDLQTFFTLNKIQADVLVTGNCLIYMKPEMRLPYVQDCINKTGIRYLILFEIARVRSAPFVTEFTQLSNMDFYLNLPEIGEARCKRKVEVYQL